MYASSPSRKQQLHHQLTEAVELLRHRYFEAGEDPLPITCILEKPGLLDRVQTTLELTTAILLENSNLPKINALVLSGVFTILLAILGNVDSAGFKSCMPAYLSYFKVLAKGHHNDTRYPLSELLCDILCLGGLIRALWKRFSWVASTAFSKAQLQLIDYTEEMISHLSSLDVKKVLLDPIVTVILGSLASAKPNALTNPPGIIFGFRFFTALAKAAGPEKEGLGKVSSTMIRFITPKQTRRFKRKAEDEDFPAAMVELALCYFVSAAKGPLFLAYVTEFGLLDCIQNVLLTLGLRTARRYALILILRAFDMVHAPNIDSSELEKSVIAVVKGDLQAGTPISTDDYAALLGCLMWSNAQTRKNSKTKVCFPENQHDIELLCKLSETIVENVQSDGLIDASMRATVSVAEFLCVLIEADLKLAQKIRVFQAGIRLVQRSRPENAETALEFLRHIHKKRSLFVLLLQHCGIADLYGSSIERAMSLLSGETSALHIEANLSVMGTAKALIQDLIELKPVTSPTHAQEFKVLSEITSITKLTRLVHELVKGLMDPESLYGPASTLKTLHAITSIDVQVDSELCSLLGALLAEDENPVVMSNALSALNTLLVDPGPAAKCWHDLIHHIYENDELFFKAYLLGTSESITIRGQCVRFVHGIISVAKDDVKRAELCEQYCDYDVLGMVVIPAFELRLNTSEALEVLEYLLRLGNNREYIEESGVLSHVPMLLENGDHKRNEFILRIMCAFCPIGSSPETVIEYAESTLFEKTLYHFTELFNGMDPRYNISPYLNRKDSLFTQYLTIVEKILESSEKACLSFGSDESSCSNLVAICFILMKMRSKAPVCYEILAPALRVLSLLKSSDGSLVAPAFDHVFGKYVSELLTESLIKQRTSVLFSAVCYVCSCAKKLQMMSIGVVVEAGHLMPKNLTSSHKGVRKKVSLPRTRRSSIETLTEESSSSSSKLAGPSKGGVLLNKWVINYLMQIVQVLKTNISKDVNAVVWEYLSVLCDIALFGFNLTASILDLLHTSFKNELGYFVKDLRHSACNLRDKSSYLITKHMGLFFLRAVTDEASPVNRRMVMKEFGLEKALHSLKLDFQSYSELNDIFSQLSSV